MIEIKNLTKTYYGDTGPVAALKGINLTIATGEIYGIIGKSGAGKSTLIRCINMLEAPDGGQVIIDGKDMTALNAADLRSARKKIGMIFQHFNLLSSANVYDNIAFPLKLVGTDDTTVEKKVRPLLELVGLKDFAERYPAQLSGGQKQRVGIARALASDPNILLCDEATSALDPQTTKGVLELIGQINRQMHLTVVVITHEMQVIKDICDKVAVIDGGVIAESGSVVDVFTNPGQPITKEFISVLLSNDLPTAFRDGAVEQEYSPDSYLLLRLIFLGESADDPVIAGMIRAFPQIECTMLFGNLDQIRRIPFGRMIIGITGEQSALAAAMDYLKAHDLRMEVIGYVRRHGIVNR